MSIRQAARRVLWPLADGLMSLDATTRTLIFPNQQNCVPKIAQIELMLRYRDALRQQTPLAAISDAEFSVFSQNGEDGILLYIFSLIGMTNRTCVEICAGTGIECNTANLIVHHGFHGLLVDGQASNVARGRAFYARGPETRLHPPIFIQSWVTRENVNDIIKNNGFRGEIDLLSLDLDGVDFWIWDAIDCIQPRVVVAEVQNIWPADVAVTVPYNPQFQAEYTPDGVDYGGASLLAFVRLARQKGYRLVGCQRYGYNAFFVREPIGESLLPEVSSADCLKHPYCQEARRRRLPKVSDREWVTVAESA